MKKLSKQHFNFPNPKFIQLIRSLIEEQVNEPLIITDQIIVPEIPKDSGSEEILRMTLPDQNSDDNVQEEYSSSSSSKFGFVQNGSHYSIAIALVSPQLGAMNINCILGIPLTVEEILTITGTATGSLSTTTFNFSKSAELNEGGRALEVGSIALNQHTTIKISFEWDLVTNLMSLVVSHVNTMPLAAVLSENMRRRIAISTF